MSVRSHAVTSPRIVSDELWNRREPVLPQAVAGQGGVVPDLVRAAHRDALGVPVAMLASARA